MAYAIRHRAATTGTTVKATIRRKTDGYYWNGTTFEVYAVAAIATYGVALAETPASSYLYVGNFPAAIVGAGLYVVDIFSCAGANLAITDTLLTSVTMNWDGTTEVVPPSLTNIAAQEPNDIG